MASIRKEILTMAGPDSAWDTARDIDALGFPRPAGVTAARQRLWGANTPL